MVLGTVRRRLSCWCVVVVVALLLLSLRVFRDTVSDASERACV